MQHIPECDLDYLLRLEENRIGQEVVREEDGAVAAEIAGAGVEALVEEFPGHGEMASLTLGVRTGGSAVAKAIYSVWHRKTEQMKTRTKAVLCLRRLIYGRFN